MKLGDEVIISEKVHFYPRDPGRIWFAANPIGGAACGPVLRGWIRSAPDGREYRGTPSVGYAWTQRLSRNTGLALVWVRRSPGEAAWLAVFSLGLAAAGAFAAGRGWFSRAAARRGWRHRWFLGTSAILTLGFAWVVTLGSFRLNEREIFGNFYDYQAASFLQGRLDVPEEAIGGEAFEAKGKLYGYFGPTPALLRLPFVATGLAFGNLSRAAMLLYFGITLAGAYLLLREARRFTGDDEDDPVPPRAATVILLTAAGWGSTVLFLASRGLIFHEAILGGIAFATASCFCSVRHLRLPESRWWIGALVAGVLSIHTRPTTGLFALTLLGCVAVLLSVLRSTGKRGVFAFYAGTVLVLFATGAADLAFRQPITPGSDDAYTTWLTPLNPFLTLRSALDSNAYRPWSLGVDDASWMTRAWFGHPLACMVGGSLLASTMLLGVA
ncbi:MAG: hypothetical protein EBR33_03650, partial [Synechococcaceae bacterium WB4_1_0192]|nr:hypothetical protein [Synechococcaceae bacterium WB4_1_0192]